jgi:hypothetical protein
MHTLSTALAVPRWTYGQDRGIYTAAMSPQTGLTTSRSQDSTTMASKRCLKGRANREDLLKRWPSRSRECPGRRLVVGPSGASPWPSGLTYPLGS